jgi:hypothetical protein
MTKRNEPIGEVDCPAKGCALRVPLFKFRPRPTENMRRMAGKLYCRCPTHGQFGGIGEAAGMQDFLLDTGNPKIWAPSETETAGKEPAEAATATPEPPAIPQKLPATAKTTEPATPAKKLPATTAAEPAAPAKKPWFSLEI